MIPNSFLVTVIKSIFCHMWMRESAIWIMTGDKHFVGSVVAFVAQGDGVHYDEQIALL